MQSNAPFFFLAERSLIQIEAGMIILITVEEALNNLNIKKRN
jgi:hypothetical protein